MYYANKKFLISVEKPEDDGFLLTSEGEIPFSKEGYYIATDENGNKFVCPETYFNENYVPVKKVSKPKRKHKSPFEEQYEKQLLEFASVQMSQEEDESYINAMKNNLVNN
jgi:hypothetical protein